MLTYFFLLFFPYTEKADALLCTKNSPTEVISLYKRFRFPQGELHSLEKWLYRISFFISRLQCIFFFLFLLPFCVLYYSIAMRYPRQSHFISWHSAVFGMLMNIYPASLPVELYLLYTYIIYIRLSWTIWTQIKYYHWTFLFKVI